MLNAFLLPSTGLYVRSMHSYRLAGQLDATRRSKFSPRVPVWQLWSVPRVSARTANVSLITVH
jgi:hypothetical protein